MACVLLWREDKDTDIHTKGRPCEGMENMTSYKTEREGSALVTPWPQTPKLQNCWKINTQSVVPSFASPSKPVEASCGCREEGRRKKRKWKSLWRTLWKWNLLTAALSALLCGQTPGRFLGLTESRRLRTSTLAPWASWGREEGWECSPVSWLCALQIHTCSGSL